MSVVTRHLLPRRACRCGTFVYTFESTSLLLQPHSQFVRGENVVKIPVHHFNYEYEKDSNENNKKSEFGVASKTTFLSLMV